MISKFYAFCPDFPAIEADDYMLDNLWKLSDEQKQHIFLDLSLEDIWKRANNFIGACEKKGNTLQYHNELLHKNDELIFHEKYIEIVNAQENVFVPLLKRLYKNYLIMDET